MDFVVRKNNDLFLPIEVKYRNLAKASISRGYHSFLDAYEPKNAVVITKDFIGTQNFGKSIVHFIPLERLNTLFPLIAGL